MFTDSTNGNLACPVGRNKLIPPIKSCPEGRNRSNTDEKLDSGSSFSHSPFRERIKKPISLNGWGLRNKQ